MATKKWKAAPSMQIETDKTYRVVIETDRGKIQLDLYPQHAPQTVNNFVFLVREGFYDGTKFHRVISNFMIQGGDPMGTGMGGPGYEFDDEIHPELDFTKPYILAMANAG